MNEDEEKKDKKEEDEEKEDKKEKSKPLSKRGSYNSRNPDLEEHGAYLPPRIL